MIITTYFLASPSIDDSTLSFSLWLSLSLFFSCSLFLGHSLRLHHILCCNNTAPSPPPKERKRKLLHILFHILLNCPGPLFIVSRPESQIDVQKINRNLRTQKRTNLADLFFIHDILTVFRMMF